MNPAELRRVIESLGRDRGLQKDIIINAIEQAILTTAQKRFGPRAVLEAHYNSETGNIDLFLFKQVVEELVDEESVEKIQLKEAQKLDPKIQVGDEIGIPLPSPDFGRIDAQAAKQVIFQKVREAEQDIIYKEYIHRKGEIISGIARRAERGNIVVDLGKTDALLSRRDVIPGEQFRPGDRVQAYLKDVVSTSHGPQIYLSRTCPEYMIKLFEQEVPEIQEGIIQIKGCAREASVRSKVAVCSKDRDLDPVGACVGMKGSRVKNILQELQGEKIDIVPWSENAVVFVQSALSPAEISSVKVDEAKKTMEIMVEDDQLSLAIGRRGQNVRLAAQLIGWRLDIVSKSKMQKRTQEVVFNLQNIEGVTETLARSIYQNGYASVRQIAQAPIEGLKQIPGFQEEEKAQVLKKNAQKVIETSGDLLAGETTTEADLKAFSAQPNQDAKKHAETRLKTMLEEMEKQKKENKS